MTRRTILAALIVALGVILTLANLREGLSFGFPLLLGLLLLADGVLRFAMLGQDGRKEREQTETPAAVGGSGDGISFQHAGHPHLVAPEDRARPSDRDERLTVEDDGPGDGADRPAGIALERGHSTHYGDADPHRR